MEKKRDGKSDRERERCIIIMVKGSMCFLLVVNMYVHVFLPCFSVL